MKNLLFIVRVILLVSVVLPLGVHAIDNIQELLYVSVDLFNSLIYIVFSFALLTFFWGLAKFISASGSDKALADGRRLMIWGVITLFIMSSVWGIVAFLQDSFDITDPYF